MSPIPHFLLTYIPQKMKDKAVVPDIRAFADALTAGRYVVTAH
jgi:hypothetical protein